LSGNPENHEQWYQIPVEVENPGAYLKTNPNTKKEIDTLNQKVLAIPTPPFDVKL